MNEVNEEAGTAKGPDGQRLTEALYTVLQAVLGDELDTLRRSVRDARADLTRQIDAARDHAGKTVDDLMKNLLSHLEELRGSLNETEEVHSQTLAELKTRMTDSVSEMKRELEKSRTETSDQLNVLRRSMEEARTETEDRLTALRTSVEEEMTSRIEDRLNTLRTTVEEEISSRTEDRVNKLHSSMQKDLTSRTSDVKRELGQLAEKLTATEQKVNEQIERSERVSGVLGNLANVFSGQLGAAATAQSGARLQQAPTGPDDAENRDLDGALDKMFSGKA